VEERGAGATQMANFAGNLSRSGRKSEQPGALVIGGDYQGLGIIRSLGRHGIPSVVIDDEHCIGANSRYVRHSVQFGSIREPEEVGEAVLSVGKRYGLEGWILFPTRDEVVAAFSQARAELSKFFRVPTPAWETVKHAWDKRNLHQLLSKLKIPAPTTRAKAWRADSRDELRQLFARATEFAGPGSMLVQELVPGDGRHQFSYCTFFKQGHSLASLVAQRRRQHPPEFGRSSTYVVTCENPLLEQYGARFLSAIDYYGLAEVEFKFDEREGTFKLHDVNLRTWGYHSVGWLAGVDFPHLLYQDQLGRSIRKCRASSGVKWVRGATDFPASLIDLVKRRLTLKEYIRSLSEPITGAVFDLSDPLPGLVEIGLLPYLMYKRGF
jgi:D-aspartate ligase